MQLPELLSALRMQGALNALDDLKAIGHHTGEELLLGLLGAEYHYRLARASERRLSSAKFPVCKEWSEIDCSLNPQIAFQEVQALSDGKFLDRRENICLLGTQGTGKTHSLIALGRELCRKGYSVRFFTACSLVNHLEEAKSKQSLSKAMEVLMKPNLLVIDELGFVPFSENGARLLFDVFASRYERGSIAISSNLGFKKWGEVFGSLELTTALIDRLTHRAHIFTYEGQSARLQKAMSMQKAFMETTNKEVTVK